MKHFYSQIKNFLNIALFLGIFLQSYLGSAQTTLTAGDILFTGYDSNFTAAAGDEYSFVLLTNISANTVISFSDRGYTGSAWQAAGGTESTVTWTSGTALPMGTEILIKGLSASTYDPSTTSLTVNGTVVLTEGTSPNGLSLSNVGDQVIVFQGGSGSITGSGVTFITGLHYFYCDTSTTTATWDSGACVASVNSSRIPPGLTGGVNAFYTGTISGTNLATSGKFNGTGVPFANAAAIKTAVLNQANWTLSLTALTMPSAVAFVGVPPAITGNPPNRTICIGSNTTFSITATDATSYQWQVNTGSGYTNISNTAPYSNVTTATLTITGATALMNGYLYRCLAIGTGSVASNGGTLTVPNINATTSQTNVSCFGGINGTATVSSPTGGIAPYSYSWSPSGGAAATASGLAPGTYTVTITDNIGCTATKSFTIIQPTIITTSVASQTNVSCFGGTNGSATVSASGGTPGYTYSWAPSGGTAATASGLSAGTYTVTVTDASSCTKTQTVTITEPAVLVASQSSQTNVSCFGGTNGSATVSVAGGTPGYTYSWSPSGGTAATASGLTQGTYTVNVTDAKGCTASQSFTITEPVQLVASAAAQTNIACHGNSTGSATVSGTGGTGTYTYSWSPSGGTAATASGLIAGTYIATITDANACTATKSFTITEPAALVASAGSQTNIACRGNSTGSATVSVTGGTGTKNYSWTPSGGTAATASGLAAGTYIVTVTDANLCTATQSFTITEPSALVASAGAQTNVSCFGGTNGSATVSVSGGAGGYTYSWAPFGGTTATASGLAQGTYIVTVTDGNGCTTTQSFTIIQPTVLVASASSQNNVSCFGGTNGSATVSGTGGTGTYSYSWSPSGGTAATASGLIAGTYIATITDTNGCTATQSFTLTQPTVLVASAVAQTNIACNGNSTGSATVSGTGGTGTYTYSWSPSGVTAATASGLTAGTHIATITDANGCTATKSFTIAEPTALVASVGSQNNVSCNSGGNGSATVNVTGGTSGYTYSWAPTGGTAATASGLSAGTYTVTVTDANLCITTQSFTITEPALLVASLGSQTNVSCNSGSNGSATVSVTGGTPGYTYSWAPTGGTAATASGLIAGTYTVTVTDANTCSTSQSFTITEPTVLVASAAAQTNVACNGNSTGSATVNATGGTGTYTYSWSPTGGTAATASGLIAGTYTVTVTDTNTCSASQSFTITEPTALIASAAAQTNVACNGTSTGSATVSAIGGTGTYTYSWAPSGGTAATASGLTAGTYTVTVTDANNCTATQSFTITEPAALVASADAQTNVSCNSGANGSATVSVTGGTPNYSYSWAPSGGTAATATGLTAGTYTVTVTDANLCTTTQSFTITEPAVLIASMDSQTNVACNGNATGSATVNVTGGTGAYSYSWSPTGGTGATASGLTAGTYTVTVTDANSCWTTQNFTITEPTALIASALSQTNVACNGTSTGSATVSATGGTGTYTYSWAPSGGTDATATGLTAGTYTVSVTDANSCITSQSFTITEPAALVASADAQTNVLCNGNSTGSATVSATGGTGTYSYSWSPSGGTAATASGLIAGTYTATVIDANSCTATQSFTITEPTALVVSVGTQTNISCNAGSNGSATVSVTGGTPGYMYSWFPTGGTAATASGLTAGNYTATVTDANGCSTTQSFIITEPAVLAATTTQTNVSCLGGSDGSATVNVTGGTGLYTYAWSPSVGTAATATGLTQGSYTVTITDANGCSITKSFSILTTPDVTAPVPNVTNLPDITNYCAILSSQISIPTATDNCTGTITGTTTAPLNYNTPGTYVITWSYDDGHGNISTQNQTLKVLASPLATFTDAAFTYDGTLHTLQAQNLPVGATVVYSISPALATTNGAINAGVYTITATVTPSVSMPNCSPVVLTAKLTINKAPQLITFGTLPVKILGGTNSFNLGATSNSGLAVSYTFNYTSALPPASISSTGLVNLLTSGQVSITASQAGDSNYLPAVNVSQLLVIKNNIAVVSKITVGTGTYNNPPKDIFYLMACGEGNVSVSILNDISATINPSANFTIPTPKPGIYKQNVTVTSEDASAVSNYTITVEKPFSFFDLVHLKFNNTLIVNNNPLTNGGYEFVAYQWFKNGQLVGTGQYYSIGNSVGDVLDVTADYKVKVTTKDGKVLQTCSSKIILQKSSEAKLYPNPAQTGKVITVEADFPEEDLQNMTISLYTVSGQLVKSVHSSTVKTEIELPSTSDGNMYVVVIEAGSIKKTLKVIVK